MLLLLSKRRHCLRPRSLRSGVASENPNCLSQRKTTQKANCIPGSLDGPSVRLMAPVFVERQQQFPRDRAELEQWFAVREEQLSARTVDSIVDAQCESIEMLQSQIAVLQSRWQRERLEAEHSIRELLEQLTAREVRKMETPPQSGTPNAGMRDAA